MKEVAIGDYKGMDLLHLFWKLLAPLCKVQQNLIRVTHNTSQYYSTRLGLLCIAPHTSHYLKLHIWDLNIIIVKLEQFCVN